MTGPPVKRFRRGRKRASHDVDVAIVGADIAGLTAAHVIAGSGRTVTVVDASAQASLHTMTGNTHARHIHAQTHTWAGDNDVLFLAERQS
ncbi:flavin-dependent dehydrogenase [Kibdelosporangium banguiense]|uniref:Flavin-dependent dehydrogenase n=1 Tax=Kibdelosporangium banguiense TaxID=1365924 RepID=A0ABS4TRQ9_9PSEU|nr:NAD(P)-binding protein [Kibdelosporangium banguiense]MBP2326630.1 flavin-dependent dehydrogenase [Kibdelosporangium banguiense]